MQPMMMMMMMMVVVVVVWAANLMTALELCVAVQWWVCSERVQQGAEHMSLGDTGAVCPCGGGGLADVVKSEPIIKESCVYSENALRGELERGSVWSVCPVSC